MNENALGFIHRFIPATEGKDAPVLLLLHGTGGTEDDLLPLGRKLLPDAALLAPRGRVSENGMARFFRRHAEGVFDIDDLKRRTHELADFVTRAAATYQFNPQRVLAVGYSNGANIAASTLLLRPATLSAAVLLRAMFPLEPETLPALQNTPVFLASGRFDPIVPVESVERLATLLRRAGANVTLRWQETGHQLANEEIVAAQSWLAQKVGVLGR